MIPDASQDSASAWRDPFTLLIVCIAGLGTAHILVRTATYGVAVTTDSIAFLSTALNFLAGEGWRYLTGSPLVKWPPLFPLVLAAFGWVGIEPLEAGRWINAIAFGLTIFAAGYWLRSHLRSRGLVLVATATLTTALPLSDLASHLLTEPLFVLFALLALMQLAAFLQRGERKALLLSAVFAALAALTRYPGVALIGVGVLLLLVRRAPPLATRLKHAIVFGAVALIPLAGVLTRNWVVSETLTGRRSNATGQSLSAGLSQTVEVFRSWIIPPNAPDGVAYLLGLAVAGLILVGAAVILRGPAPRRRLLEPTLPFGAFTVGYIAFMVAVVPLTVIQRIDSRFLLPLYAPLLLTAGFLLDRFLSIKATGWMGTARCVVVSVVLLATLAHTGVSARGNLRLTARAWRVGYEQNWMYNTAYWQQSETLKYLRDNHIEGTIYSNNRELAWFADRTAPPGKHRKIPRKMRWPQIEAGAHIVWFDLFYNRARFSYDDLDFRVLPGVEIAAELADGTVFRRTAYEPFDAERHRARRQRYVDQLIEQASDRVVRAGWTVYRTGRKLIYLKQPCAQADLHAKFVLHIVPTDLADLPAHRQQYDSDNLDFYFNWRGFRAGDQCIAIVPLPAYAIDRIHIGQWISAEDRTLWEAEFSASR